MDQGDKAQRIMQVVTDHSFGKDFIPTQRRLEGGLCFK